MQEKSLFHLIELKKITKVTIGMWRIWKGHWFGGRSTSLGIILKDQKKMALARNILDRA